MSRAEFDRAAAATAAILGLVLVGVTAYPVVVLFQQEEEKQEFDLAWVVAEHGSDELVVQNGAASASASVAVPPPGMRVATVTVSFPTCDDGARDNIDDEAVATWSLDGAGLGDATAGGSFTCAQNPGSITFNVTAEPAGTTTAPGIAEATAKAWEDAGGNVTTTYTLNVSFTRGPGAVPLPLPGQLAPTFTLQATLEVTMWTLTVSEKAEVTK